METFNDYKRLIELRIIQDDAESILSLMQTEHDAVFQMAILPYYALFIQSIQEYFDKQLITDDWVGKIKDIRNYIKIFGDSFGKSKNRINMVDADQNNFFQSKLRFAFLGHWNIHYNIGTYWINDKHMIGNTQMYSDYLGVKAEENDKEKVRKQFIDLGYQCGYVVSSIKTLLSDIIIPPSIERAIVSTKIEYYFDLNTNKLRKIFIGNNKELNIFFMNLVSNMNFVKFVLVPMFKGFNPWIFRVEYVVTYNTYKALKRLKSHSENNSDICIDLDKLKVVLKLADNLFPDKFRNCMMHYGLDDKLILQSINIKNPLYEIIGINFGGNDVNEYYSKLRQFGDAVVQYLERNFQMNMINLQKL